MAVNGYAFCRSNANAFRRGHALAEEGKLRFCRGIVNQRDAGYCEGV
jgi:hypothetical protein